MLEFLDTYIGCSFIGILSILAGKKLFKSTEKIGIIKTIISIIIIGLISSIFNIYATDTLTTIIKIILSYIVLAFYYYIIFKVGATKAITGGFLTYIVVIMMDILLGLVIAILEVALNINTMEFFEKKTIVDFIIYSTSYLVILIAEKKFIYLIENTDFNKKIISVLTVLLIITIALIGLKLPLSEWKFSLDFIVTMLTMLTFCIIGIYMLIQKSEIKKTSLKYQELVKYSDITNRLLEDYRMVSHEHKNQLSIIRGMVNNSNKEVSDYIDSLLEKRNIIKYQWIGELNKLPLSGLKGLINYKIMEMEKEKLNISIVISKEITKTKIKKLTANQKDNLYSIIGIYLDNAIQSSKESKKKEISLEIYKQKQEIILILANTFKGKINLAKIDDYGYTTKGKKHGVGLHIVKNILDESKIFAQNRNIVDDYFIQELHINLKEIK